MNKALLCVTLIAVFALIRCTAQPSQPEETEPEPAQPEPTLKHYMHNVSTRLQ